MEPVGSNSMRTLVVLLCRPLASPPAAPAIHQTHLSDQYLNNITVTFEYIYPITSF